MPSPWKTKLKDITITRYRQQELLDAIEDMKIRGFTQLSEPKQVYSVQVNHQMNYSNLNHPRFYSKDYENYSKWVCRMRPPALS